MTDYHAVLSTPPDTADCTTNGGMEKLFFAAAIIPALWCGYSFSFYWLALTCFLFSYLSLCHPPLHSPIQHNLICLSWWDWPDILLMVTYTSVCSTISNWPAVPSTVEQRLDSLINKSFLKHYYPTWWGNKGGQKTKRLYLHIMLCSLFSLWFICARLFLAPILLFYFTG